MSDDPADGPVLDPDEFDISKDERVEEIGQDRYVVSASDRPPRVPDERADPAELPPGEGEGQEGAQQNRDPRTDGDPAAGGAGNAPRGDAGVSPGQQGGQPPPGKQQSGGATGRPQSGASGQRGGAGAGGRGGGAAGQSGGASGSAGGQPGGRGAGGTQGGSTGQPQSGRSQRGGQPQGGQQPQGGSGGTPARGDGRAARGATDGAGGQSPPPAGQQGGGQQGGGQPPQHGGQSGQSGAAGHPGAAGRSGHGGQSGAGQPGSSQPGSGQPGAGHSGRQGAAGNTSGTAAGNQGVPGLDGSTAGSGTAADPSTAGARDPPARDRTDASKNVVRGAPGKNTGESLDAAEVRKFLARSLAGNEFDYGFDATVSFGDKTTRHRMVSNDVTTTFETLVTWFAHNAGGDTPPERVLGLLLSEADTSVELPPDLIRKAAVEHDLSADDSIGDLLRAVKEDGSITME